MRGADQGAVATRANPDANDLRRDRFDFQFIAGRGERLPAQESSSGGADPGGGTGSCGRSADDDANRPQAGGTFSTGPAADVGFGRFNEARTGNPGAAFKRISLQGNQRPPRHRSDDSADTSEAHLRETSRAIANGGGSEIFE